MDMTLKVSTPGKQDLVCSFHQQSGIAETNLTVFADGVQLPHCLQATDGTPCRCAVAMMPLITWFKDLKSTQEVRLSFVRGEHSFAGSLKTTLAANMLESVATVYAGCPFFSQFKPFVDNAFIPLDERQFFYMLLSSSVIERLFQDDTVQLGDVISDIRRMVRRARACLWNVLRYSRCVVSRDAILNSLNMTFTMCNLIDNCYDEIVSEYKSFFRKQTIVAPSIVE
jgi:hypothetical protein